MRRLLGWLLAPPLVLALTAGCFGADEDPRASLVPYPHLGDVAVYEASGALVEFARWENGIPFAAATAQVRLSVAPGGDALDGARAVHPSFRVTTQVAEAGAFVQRSERWIAPRQEAVVQSFYPLSQDQSIVAFDERGFPWLFGASALFGEEIRPGVALPFPLPDNLGRATQVVARWVPAAAGGRVALEGVPGMNATLWMEPGSAWPARVEIAIDSPALAPHVRSDGGYPVSMVARRVSLVTAGDPVPPRDRGASFGEDASVVRAVWDGEKPPDGEPPLEYPLAEAVAEAKLLDKPLADWLAAHDAPILYRGTFQTEAGPVEGSRQAHWLLQWVARSNEYYEVQIARVFPPVAAPAPAPAVGVPRVESSGPAKPPADANHGWFARASAPEEIVPLAEGIRVVREVFGAQEVQVFLRSFADPPGYSYFLDGGFEGPGRYTVVYNPNTGFMEEATGPVQPRVSP